MNTLTKTLLAVAATMLVAGGAYAATTPKGNDPSPAAPAADVTGPCDEAEHANDPRCAGAQVPEDNANQAEDRHHNEAEHHHANGDDNQVEDVGDDNPGGGGGSGEAERHDNSGPGSMNSGPGNSEDHGGQAQAEDNSGPSSDDSGHSESGHSGSDDSSSDDSGSSGSGRD